MLDQILISNTDIVLDTDVIDIDRNISDHDGTLVKIKIPHLFNRTILRKIWMYKNANYAELNKTISDFNWEAYLSECNDVDLMCERFTNKYLEMLEK